MSAHTLRWRGGWARIGPWRSDTEVAHLTLGASRPPSLKVVEQCLDALRVGGYEAVITSALTAADSLPFVDAGFTLRERLHLFAHELQPVQRASRVTRRARRSDREAVLNLDQHAFDEFWQIDHNGLGDALRATPAVRFRVLDGDSVGITAYAITGRAGRHGYLQRLAVHPHMRQHGFGRDLVIDALRWLARTGTERALVNTQLDNAPAARLYESCGFHRLPVGLCVLGRSL